VRARAHWGARGARRARLLPTVCPPPRVRRPYNLERICADYEVEVEADSRDFIERCMPCLFRGIGGVEHEPPWYAGW